MNLKKIILLGGVGLASAAVGILLPSILIPTLMSGGHAPETAAPATSHDAKAGHDKEKSGHDAKKEAAPKADAHAADHGGHGSKDHGGHGAKDDAQNLRRLMWGFCWQIVEESITKESE